MYIGQNFSMSPERQAEEGKVGPDFLPTSVHAKPVNYPVGKPLEVGSLFLKTSSGFFAFICNVIMKLLISPSAKGPRLTIATKTRRIFLNC